MIEKTHITSRTSIVIKVLEIKKDWVLIEARAGGRNATAEKQWMKSGDQMVIEKSFTTETITETTTES